MKVERAAVYCRVSSKKQAEEGYSIDAQKAVCEEYIASQGMKCEGVFIDAGYSGGLSYKKRPALRELMQAVERDEIDVIVVLKLDRLFRSLRGFYDALQVLEKHRVRWICVKEPQLNIDTASGEMMLSMMLVVAQFERRVGGERVRIIQEDIIKEGRLITGSVPFGFRHEVDSEGIKRLVPDEKQVAIVKDAFEYYLATQSNRATRLYIERKYGLAWTWQKFESIINNDLFTGCYRGVKDYCTPSIDSDLIERVRHINRNFKSTHWKAKHVYLFQGLVRCPVCGNILQGTADRKKDGSFAYYYRCQKHANRLACSWKRTVGEARIEPIIIKTFTEYLNSQNISAEVKPKATPKPNTEKRRKQVESKIERLTKGYIRGVIPLEEYEEIRRELEQELEELKPPEPPKKIRSVPFKVKDFEEFYEGLSREDKRAFWREMLTEIKLSEDGKGVESITI